MPGGWRGAELLLLLCFAKLLASSLTIGSGGSAGDFAPSLVIGGIFGGAFGRIAQAVMHDASIDPGAFALVGMGTFYGGIAHVPISSLIIVSELAGNYDLLVPLMLAEGIAFVALRNRTLYDAQVPAKSESPAHGALKLPEALRSIRVADVMTQGRPYITLPMGARGSDIVRQIPSETWQDAFPVLDDQGTLRGLITVESLRLLVSEGDGLGWAIAADLMQQPVSVKPEDDLQAAAKAMLAHGLREVPVVDEAGKIVGFLDEAETAKAYVDVAGAMKKNGH
jgi:CIC family chloride channel protein